MKIIDLLNKIANREEVPKKIKYKKNVFIYNAYVLHYVQENNSDMQLLDYLEECRLNDEVEIIEDKFTKEDFIKERMELDGITREQFDEMYEVKECHCGAPYCKGFIAEEKYFEMDCSTEEEKKIEQFTEEEMKVYHDMTAPIDDLAHKVYEIIDKINGE